MSSLVVVAFEEEAQAGRFLDEVDQLQKQKIFKLDDAATLVRAKNGKIRIKQAASLVGVGALGGAFWGLLVGLLFFVPVAGMATGAAIGAGLGKASDYGINDDFIKELGEHLEPGTSAICLLVRESSPEEVIDNLRYLGGEIIHTSLSSEQEARLKEAFFAL